MTKSPIYLDYQASTPLDKRVWERMTPWFIEKFGNAHSNNHSYGWEASKAVDIARSQVANLLNAEDEEIVFTSGATESCNLAIRGIAGASNSGRKKLITVQTEHAAVFETVGSLDKEGFNIVIQSVNRDGLIDINELNDALDEQTLLVSVMMANNEIGVLQPISEIAEMCHKVGAYMHTDATQAIGRIHIDLDDTDVDLLSLSSHKIYGPKGVGALFIRNNLIPNFSSILTGGGQERGLRGGTLPIPLIVGLGEACRILTDEWLQDVNRVTQLTKSLWDALKEGYPAVILFGHPTLRVCGNLSLGFPGFSAEQIITTVTDKLAISSGSACSSASFEPSRILSALGYNLEEILSGVRVSLGRFTTSEDIAMAKDALLDAVSSVR